MRAMQTAHQVASVLELPVLLENGLSEGMLQRMTPLLLGLHVTSRCEFV